MRAAISRSSERLRTAGHDVVAVAEVAPRAPDTEVIDLAVREGRVLLTEDKDFGQLVYADARDSNGVILLRFPPSAREALASLVQETIQRLGDRLTDSFVVLEPNRVRIGRSPGR